MLRALQSIFSTGTPPWLSPQLILTITLVSVLSLSAQMTCYAVELSPSWNSSDVSVGRLVCWVDIDGDGWLDLSILDGGLPPFDAASKVKVYKNASGLLTPLPCWQSPELERLNSFAWGDLDHDAYPDLACDFGRTLARVYRTTPTSIGEQVVWWYEQSETTELFGFDERTILWADIDNDGWQDIVAAFWSGVNIFYNHEGILSSEPDVRLDWNPSQNKPSGVDQLAVGDLTMDGFPELAVSYIPPPLGGSSVATAVFNNPSGMIETAPMWRTYNGGKVSFADLNNDGFADLTINSWGYFNFQGALEPVASFGRDAPYSEFGDINQDGYPDIIYAMDERNELFLNHSGSLDHTPAWRSHDIHRTGSCAFGDMDKDSFTDIAAANFDSFLIYRPQPAGVYKNLGYIPPNGPPMIVAAGFADTNIRAGQLSIVRIEAVVLDPSGQDDINSVQLTYDDNPTGIALNDEGIDGDTNAHDSIFTFSLPVVVAEQLSILNLGFRVADYEQYEVNGGFSLTIPFRW